MVSISVKTYNTKSPTPDVPTREVNEPCETEEQARKLCKLQGDKNNRDWLNVKLALLTCGTCLVRDSTNQGIRTVIRANWDRNRKAS